jgi:IPT/TIG domain
VALFKHRLGLRVTALAVVVALFVLGLQAPALAVSPTISSFSPTSGPTDCVVVITGMAFTDFMAAQTDLEFVAGATVVNAADFAVISAMEIWATVPVLTPGTSYNIRITNPDGTSTSSGTFLSTAGAGECAPTVASFAPTCGEAGTTMAITGTNLLAPTLTGGEVRFNPYGASEVAIHTVPDASSPTSLRVIVPATAAVGPFRVMTFATTGGTVLSAVSFAGPCHGDPAVHSRSVTLRLRRHLVARGVVSSDDGFAGCVAGVPVKVQRRVEGEWKTVRTTTTSPTGSYGRRIPDKAGRYRARAPRIDVNGSFEICLRAISPVRTRS